MKQLTMTNAEAVIVRDALRSYCVSGEYALARASRQDAVRRLHNEFEMMTRKPGKSGSSCTSADCQKSARPVLVPVT